MGGTHRAFDICAASGALALASPLAMAAAVGVAAEHGLGNMFFRQGRFHPGDPDFSIIKFRTTAPRYECQQSSIEITTSSRFSNLLRRSGVDELPQLMRALTGSMTIFGVRPLVEEDLNQRLEIMHAADPQMCENWRIYYETLPPAVTGPGSLWYHSADLSEIPPAEITRGVMRADVKYIETASLAGDVRLLSTAPKQVGRAVMNFLHK